MNKGSANVDVVTLARKRPGNKQIDEQSDAADTDYRQALHRYRRVDSVYGLDHDPQHHCDHEQRVDERSNDFDACQSKRMPLGYGSARDDVGDQREQQRRRVGRHVAGIGQQRQRTRPQARE